MRIGFVYGFAACNIAGHGLPDPDTALWHWCYLVIVLAVLALAYVLFMKKYYHLHEEYLASLKK